MKETIKKNKFEALRDGVFIDFIAPKETPSIKEFKSFLDRFDICKSFLNIEALVFLGFKYDDTYNIPEYQRELKWTKIQKQSLIQSILLGNPIGDFLIKEVEDNDGATFHYYIIDGQQRINAIREFAIGKLKLADGRTIKDLHYSDGRAFFDYSTFNGWKVRNISLEDEVKLYLEKNIGGTNHTKREIDKARRFIPSDVS